MNSMNPRRSFAQLLLCFCLLSNWIQSGSGLNGLYAPEDKDVLPLNSDSFKELVTEDDEEIFWVVEFYNAWCGHCINFAPIWKLVAHSFEDWNDLVKIAAIDCSQSENLKTCREHDVDRYPTIKVFMPRQKNKARIVKLIESQEILIIRKEILTMMTNFTPSEWPLLTPLSTIEDVWKEKKPDHAHISLIFEEDKSILGKEVILDMRHTQNMLVRRMNQESITKYGISKLPSLYKVNPDSGYSLLAAGKGMLEKDRKTFVAILKGLAQGPGHKLDQESHGKNLHGSKISMSGTKYPDNMSHFNRSVISMQDLESALHYSFRQEIAICKIIDRERFIALQNFVKILLKYFPGRPPVVGFLKNAVLLLNNLRKSSLSGEEWIEKIDQLQDKDHFLPDVIEWECCKGSLPKYRGYPCAMWTLFHTLTVSAYHQIHARPSSPLEVLSAIRGYMKEFFGCEECSKNFLKMGLTLEDKVKDQRSSVLWLWDAHNQANKRLHGDVSEDPKCPKIQFPSRKACPGCYLVKSGANIVNEGWNEDVVLNYLLNVYSGEKIVLNGNLRNWSSLSHSNPSYSERKSKKLKAKDSSDLDWWEKKQQEQDLILVERLRIKKRENARKTVLEGNKVDKGSTAEFIRGGGWGFTHLDLSMCVVFYVFSTLIILLLYHHFIVRRGTSLSRSMCCNCKV